MTTTDAHLAGELARIFLEDARAQLAILADDGLAREARLAAAESLRGAAGLVGQPRVRDAAGEVADALRSRRGAAASDEALARLTLLVDGLALALATDHDGAALDGAETELLRRFFRAEAAEHLDGLSATLAELERWRGRPEARPLIDELLRKTHTIKGSASMVGLAHVTEAADVVEEAFARLRAGGEVTGLADAVDALREVIASADAPAEAAVRLQALRTLLAAGPRAAAAAAGNADERPRRADDDRLQVVRVDATRLDQLVDAAGELVFDRTRIERKINEIRSVARDLARARAGLRLVLRHLRAGGPGMAALARQVGSLEDDFAAHVAEIGRAAGALLDDAEALRRTTAVLHDGLTRVRMTSLRALFQRLGRQMREAERASEGKRIRVKVSGEDTELDRALVDKLTDPLIQLLRNAVAHAIEPSAERVARGKPSVGEITLSARHQGDSVFIEVADDGAGIDPARIRASLVAGGAMSAEAAGAATDERIIAAIFEPGVSTRESADELAGRGVGLDVVREAVARLGGEIAVTSQPGVGTRFSMRVPLTTAVTQAFLFKVGGQTYAIPQVHVVGTMVVDAPAPETVRQGTAEHTVPLISLHRILQIADVVTTPTAGQVPILVLEFAGRRFAATTDKHVGVREIVIKSLGTLLAPVGLYGGATLSGNGKVQLILDVAALAQAAYVPTARPPAEPGEITVDAPVRARILVVDDSRTVREAVTRMLVGAGHVVDDAGDGVEAWDLLHDCRYDLVVTDLEMPRLGGLALVERMRAEADLAAVPVLVISTRASAPVRERAAAAGADDFLAKPVAHDELCARAVALLARRRS